MVLFDTTIMVDALRNNKDALRTIEAYSGEELLATSIITKYEIMRGVTKKGANIAAELLERFVILDFDEVALVEAVKIYQSLSAEGKMISELDIMIAAIAVANDEVLITRDKDFANLNNSKIIVLK